VHLVQVHDGPAALALVCLTSSPCHESHGLLLGCLRRQGAPRGDNIDRLLGKCVEQWSQLGEREVVSLKALARPSRSNTVRDFHQLGSIKGVDFAESVQVGCAGFAECLLLHMRRCDATYRHPGATMTGRRGALVRWGVGWLASMQQPPSVLCVRRCRGRAPRSAARRRAGAPSSWSSLAAARLTAPALRVALNQRPLWRSPTASTSWPQVGTAAVLAPGPGGACLLVAVQLGCANSSLRDGVEVLAVLLGMHVRFLCV
jgi:hypothetical protein